MLRPYGQPDNVPAPLQGLPRSRLCPALLGPHGLDNLGQLGHRGHVDHQHATGDHQPGDRVEHLPRRQHVQHYPVDRAVGQLRVGDIADDQLPVFGRLAVEVGHVATSMLGMIGALLIGDHLPLRPDRSQ